MAIAKTKHFVYLPGVVNAKIEVMEPQVYTYIKAETGILEPGLLYTPALRLTSNELRRNGVVVQVTVRTDSGRSHKIICATENLSSALPGLVGKQFPEQVGSSVVLSKITKASMSRKRSRL